MNEYETLETVRNFLAFSDKPPNIGPVDILHIVHLMLRKAEDHDVFDSQQTLARMFGCEWKTIQRSQQKLASPEIDWIARPQQRGKPNALSLKFQNIPGEEILRLKITPEAKLLAGRYHVALRKLGRKKFPKQWIHQQFASAQRIIDACNGDIELAAQMIGHALSHPDHHKRARISLYHLYGRWKKVTKSYSAKLEAEEGERQVQQGEEKQIA